MRNHPMALANEGITPERYTELRAICGQYPDYKRTLERARHGLVEDPRRRRSRSSAWKQPDPTGNAAAVLADRFGWMSERVRLIEHCAREAAGSAVAPALIESVTEGRTYDALRHRPPCGRRFFYAVRLGFFVLLDVRLRNG